MILRVRCHGHAPTERRCPLASTAVFVRHIRPKRTLVVARVFAALIAAGCSAGNVGALVPQGPLPAGPSPSSFVRIEAAGVDAKGAAVVAPGTVTFDEGRVAAVIPPVQGRVMRVFVNAGDRVAAGDALAIVYSSEVAGAAASLSVSRINRIAAEEALARAERLEAEGAGSIHEVIEARTALANARAEEERARAVLRSLGTRPVMTGTYILRAPMAGTVIRRSLRVGSIARPDAAEPAFLVADLGHMWVLAHLHEAQGSAVNPGDRAEIEIPALPGRRYEAVVERVADAVDPNTRTLVVRIGLDNPDHALRPEMFARVTIRAHPSSVVLLPSTALITQRDGYAVFVETSPGHLERRRVRTGAELGDYTQILDGVQPGERVVVEGALLLEPSAAQLL